MVDDMGGTKESLNLAYMSNKIYIDFLGRKLLLRNKEHKLTVSKNLIPYSSASACPRDVGTACKRLYSSQYLLYMNLN